MAVVHLAFAANRDRLCRHGGALFNADWSELAVSKLAVSKLAVSQNSRCQAFGKLPVSGFRIDLFKSPNKKLFGSQISVTRQTGED